MLSVDLQSAPCNLEMDPVERLILFGIVAVYRGVQALMCAVVIALAFEFHWVLGLIASYAGLLAVSALFATRRQRFPSPEL
jgi:hypothetical protein